MGVRDMSRYAEIKEALGIPEDEPIFIIRGKDKLAPAMVDLYELLYGSAIRAATQSNPDQPNDQEAKFMYEIGEVYREVRRYQTDHPELVRLPD